MATNTDRNIGIRTFHPAVNSHRNFENSGTVAYVSRKQGLILGTTTYNVGDTIAFDVGGTSYSAGALQTLLRYWEQGWIAPLV